MATKEKQIGIRLDEVLLKRIDRQIERIQKRTPGIGLSRTNVARALIVQALDAAELADFDVVKQQNKK